MQKDNPQQKQDKLIVITGASSGIGYALSIEVANRGHNVLAIARREQQLKQLKAENSNIDILSADISTPQGRDKLVSYLSNQDNSIHVIHNAAIAMPKTLELLSELEWQQALATNLEAPMWLTKACVPFFKNSRVLHISSGLAHYVLSGTAAYCITKAGLYMLYQVINAEYDPEIVIAGSLRPGVIDTPMQDLLRNTDDKLLPSKSMFEGFYQDQQLRSPELVAQFIADVLFNMYDDKFKGQEWDIDKDFEN
jgi:NAD(P)-dependent dehydrogenase (short-subunit alcohol dehydrogenase family)